MSGGQEAINVDSSFLKSLTSNQRETFDKLIQQNNFLRESIVTIEKSATDRVAQLNAELEDADNSIDNLESQIAGLRVEISRLQAQNEDLLEVVDTATESAKMSMMREANVTKDAEKHIQEKMSMMEEKVSQAEASAEQKYIAIMHELDEEKVALENKLNEVQAELESTLIVVEHKTQSNNSLSKQVQELEAAKRELEQEAIAARQEADCNILKDVRAELEVCQKRNSDLEDALARVKWRSKEEIDTVNSEMEKLRQALSSAEEEQRMISEELVRVMAERDSIEAEVEEGRLSIQQRIKNSGDVSDLESVSVSNSLSPSPVPVKSPRGSPSKTITSPRGRPPLISERSALSLQISVSGEGTNDGNLTVSLDDHRAKMAEKQAAVEDAKKKNLMLTEEIEMLRRQHTELIENNMLERKNREKLLKSAQKDEASAQKQLQTCKRRCASVEKELTDYLAFHKRQTEIKDTTIELHKELAKSRAANAELASQLADLANKESYLRGQNKDLEGEVSLLLSEVNSLQNELDSANSKLLNTKWFSDDDDDSDSSSDSDRSADKSEFLPNGNGNKLMGPETPQRRRAGQNRTPKTPCDYETMKKIFLANALNSYDKQRRASSASSVASSRSRGSKPKPTSILNDLQSPIQSAANGTA